jgi:autotransporter-associated beta strand protein
VNVGAIAGSSPWTVQGDLTIGENVNFDYGSFSSTLSYSGDVIVGGTLGATNGARSFTIANGNELRLVNAGTLNIASDQTVTIDGSVRSTASAGQIATISGGTLSLGGGSRTFDVAAGTGGAGLTVSSNIENGSLIKTGGGALTLTGTNSFTGAAQIEEGTLVIGAASSLAGMSSIAIDAGTVLDLTSVTGFVLGSGQQLSGRGTILGDFEFGSGSLLVFDPNGPLSIGAGTLSFAFGSDFGVANLIGLDENTPVDTYTLFAEDVGGIIDTTNLLNFEMPVSIGGGKSAYFQSGSLQLVVVPEPSALLLGGGGLLLAGLGAWRRRLRAGLNVQAN